MGPKGFSSTFYKKLDQKYAMQDFTLFNPAGNDWSV